MYSSIAEWTHRTRGCLLSRVEAVCVAGFRVRGGVQHCPSAIRVTAVITVMIVMGSG